MDAESEVRRLCPITHCVGREYLDLLSPGTALELGSKTRIRSQRYFNSPQIALQTEWRYLPPFFGVWMKTRSRQRIPDRQLHLLVRRLLRSNQPEIDIPVIISPAEG